MHASEQCHNMLKMRLKETYCPTLPPPPTYNDQRAVNSSSVHNLSAPPPPQPETIIGADSTIPLAEGFSAILTSSPSGRPVITHQPPMSPISPNQSHFWGPVRTQLITANDGARTTVTWHVPITNSDLQIIIETMPDPKRNPHAFTKKMKALQIAYQCSAYDMYRVFCACLGVQITKLLIPVAI